MISFFRRALKSPIVIGLFALVIVAFIVTGVGDPLGGGVASDTLAKVGDTEISDRQVTTQFDRTLSLVRQEQPDMTTEQAVDEGLVGITLDRLIGATALAEFADALGLGTSKRLIDAEIAGVAAFAGPGGGFDEQTYRQFLQRENIAEQSLRADIEGDVKRRQLLSLVTNISGTPDGIAEPLALVQLEQRTLQLGAVPFQEMTDLPAATDADVEAYYRTNIARFTIPERRKFRFAVIDRNKLAEDVTVSEKDIAAAYRESADLYGATESRKLRQVVVQNQAQAVEITKRVKAGEPLAAVAADMLDYTASDLDLGTQTKNELAGAINADVAEAVFAARSKGIVGPIESDFGWHVIAVDEVISGTATPLEQVRGEIEQRLKADRVEGKLADLVGEAQDGFADGASLTEVAEKLSLDIVDAPPLTQAGLTPDNPDFRLDPALQQLVTTVFEYDPDEEPVAEEINEALYALVDVEEIVPPTPLPLADIRPQVEGQMNVERQVEAAKAVADEIAKAVRGGADMSAELRKRGMPAAQEATLRRIELSAQQQIPAAITLGFVQKKGETRVVADPQSGAALIVRTADIVPGKIADAPQLVATIKSQLREATATEMQQAFVAAISNHVGVEKYPNAINAVEARYKGAALTGE